MECGKADGLIEKYTDGKLRAAHAADLERHLAACARCRARVEAARRVSKTLEETPPEPAPAGFAERVMEAVRRDAKPPLD
jgi:anti-sigma factor RsiW